MKKGLIFFLGMIAGAILTVGILYFIGTGNNSNAGNGGFSSYAYGDPGISLFAEPGDVLPQKSFRVFQVLPNGTALAQTSEKLKVEYNFQYGDPIVLLLPSDNNSYYDDQVIKTPTNKVTRQIGTYRYETKNDFVKTVPVVGFLDK